VLSYPGPAGPGYDGAAGNVMVGLHLARPDGGGELSFFSTITTFGTALDITVAELSIEAFFPADATTAAALHAAASQAA
jgi:MmyB-like transcription regulator ligand binding domain